MAQAYNENLKQALDTLRAHKMRSALTVFGVVLGVSVIMLVAGLLSGFDQKIQENINQFGADTAFITKWDQGRHNGPPPLEERQRKPLTVEDAKALEEILKVVAEARLQELGTGDIAPHGVDAGNGHQVFENVEGIHAALQGRIPIIPVGV